MHALRRRIANSLAAQAVIAFFLGVGVNCAFFPHGSPVLWLVRSAFYTMVAVGILAVRRRRTGRAVGTDAQGLTELQRGLARREVPSAPEERQAMRRYATAGLRTMERGRRWLPYYLGFMVLSAVALLALAAANGGWRLPLIYAVLVLGFCFWIVWMRGRALARLHFMLSAVGDGDSGTAPE